MLNAKDVTLTIINALECTNVIVLHSNYRYVSVTHVAIFGVQESLYHELNQIFYDFPNCGLIPTRQL